MTMNGEIEKVKALADALFNFGIDAGRCQLRFMCDVVMSFSQAAVAYRTPLLSLFRQTLSHEVRWRACVCWLLQLVDYPNGCRCQRKLNIIC